MSKFMSILVNKTVSGLLKVTKPVLHKDGSVLPGAIACKFDKDILDKLEYPKYIIGVTGSSGKGSTTKLIANILQANGVKVVWNESGSNLYNAATTLLLNNSTLSGKVKADVLLLELDESYIKTVFNKKSLTHLVVTNITRDQPARNGHVDLIFDKIKNSIDEETTLILNADDPIVNRLKIDHPKVITYGIGDNDYTYKTPLSDTLDQCYCPVCGDKLIYNYYHYGHLGDYRCPGNDFSRSPVNYEATDLNLENKTMFINGNPINLHKDIMFNAYAILAAYATLDKLLSNEQITKGLNASKKEEVFPTIDGRDIEMLDSKNENNLSFVQSIDYIVRSKGPKTVIMGFDNVSRRYEYNDLSWLYDIDYEKLANDEDITRIFCIGRFRYDVYARLIHAGINKKIITVVDDYKVNLIKELKNNSSGKIYSMVFLDMMDDILKSLSEVPNEKR